MPARAARVAEAIRSAAWAGELDDACLFEVVLEAVMARASAIRHAGNARAIAAGDAVLEGIKSGRVTGSRACKKAAVAVRKYNRAYAGSTE